MDSHEILKPHIATFPNPNQQCSHISMQTLRSSELQCMWYSSVTKFQCVDFSLLVLFPQHLRWYFFCNLIHFSLFLLLFLSSLFSATFIFSLIFPLYFLLPHIPVFPTLTSLTSISCALHPSFPVIHIFILHHQANFFTSVLSLSPQLLEWQL